MEVFLRPLFSGGERARISVSLSLSTTVPLCERCRSHVSWTALFIARCECNVHHRWAGFLSMCQLVSSDNTYMYCKEAKSMHKWFADSISFMIMPTDSSFTLQWMMILPFFDLRLPARTQSLQGFLGVQILSTFQGPASFCGSSFLSDVPSHAC